MRTALDLCEATKSLLLVVDVQERLCAAMADDERARMLKNTGTLLHAAAKLEIPVLITEQYPQGLGVTESSLLDRLPARTYKFEKTGFSCCAAIGFTGALEASGRTQVILAGLETHVCVLQTALDLVRLGWQAYVVEDAVCSRQATCKRNALRRMQQAGVVVTITESVIFEWLGDAAHPVFKDLSRLIR
jgi:nicotinamidase-related amidase